jgi:hypothetical protein
MSEESLLKRFPNLISSPWHIYSARSGRCNCAGFVIGFEANEMWPVEEPYSSCYWPEHLSKELSVPNFQKAYESFEFTVCDNGSFDDSIVKIVIYKYANEEPSHVAWQHGTKRHWHSKIGSEEDIIHELEALSGPKRAYGTPALFMQIPLEGFRKLWHRHATSRSPRNDYQIAQCELELGLNP